MFSDVDNTKQKALKMQIDPCRTPFSRVDFCSCVNTVGYINMDA